MTWLSTSAGLWTQALSSQAVNPPNEYVGRGLHSFPFQLNLS